MTYSISSINQVVLASVGGLGKTTGGPFKATLAKRASSDR